MRQLPSIPLHVPSYALSPLARAGVLIRSLQQRASPDASEHQHEAPHRDSHYLLVLLTEGELRLQLDFEPLVLTGPTVGLVCPGQVHQLVGAAQPQGWVLSFEPDLLDADFQLVLEQGLREPLALQERPAFTTQARTLAGLLADCQAGAADAYTGRVLQLQLLALLSLLAGQLGPAAEAPAAPSRGQQLEQAFQRLLRQHYVQWKQPAQYAAALAITGSHLNDTVKGLTGTSVSGHIQQRSVLEAKRLLGFTTRSVKEIGYALGYDEPVYFGKLFRKHVGLTPQQFRHRFRE